LSYGPTRECSNNIAFWGRVGKSARAARECSVLGVDCQSERREESDACGQSGYERRIPPRGRNDTDARPDRRCRKTELARMLNSRERRPAAVDLSVGPTPRPRPTPQYRGESSRRWKE